MRDTNDLVKSLRSVPFDFSRIQPSHRMIKRWLAERLEAADEIERLRNALEEIAIEGDAEKDVSVETMRLFAREALKEKP